MGKRHRAPLPELGVVLADWLRRLAADHDGAALSVAQAIASLIIEDGQEMWFALRRISDLTEVSTDNVAGILRRLRHRGRVHFERRDDRRDGVNPEYRFTIPSEGHKPVVRTRVWPTKEVKK